MTVKLMAEEWPEQMFQLNNENALVQKAVPNVCIVWPLPCDCII